MATYLLSRDIVAPTTCPLTVPLEDAVDPRECGDKAANLACLLKRNVPVPAGVVITNAAFESFLEASALRTPIADLWRSLQSHDSLGLKRLSEAIRALIFSALPPPQIREAVDEAVTSIGEGPFMVRSSARGEDGITASFAGQLDSIGDVPADQVLEAVVKVWASRWSERALAYGFAKGTALDGMGVIVQRQIAARWSGVLFTEAPADRGRMLVEFCSGMGEALVSGRSNPGRLTIARDSLGYDLQAQPDDCRSALSSFVNDRNLRTLACASLDIERQFGRPQDIEWAIQPDGRLWFVQSRPITVSTANGGGRSQTSACEAQRRHVHWSNANVNENFPDPVSPLLYSIASAGYYHYFRNLGRALGISSRRLAAMEQPLRHIIGVHGARMYYNLTSIHSVLRSAPFGELLAASFNQFVGAEATDAEPAVRATGRAASRAAQTLELARVVLQTTGQYLRVEQRVARFERRVDEFADRTHPEVIRDRPLIDLLDDFRRFLQIRCRQWNDAALADAGSMVCYGVLQRLLARAFPEEDQQALHNSLLKALPGLVSGQPAVELWKLAEHVRANHQLTQLFLCADPPAVLSAVANDVRFSDFRRAFTQFQEQWGFRCSGELMLTVPSFQEDPAPLVGLIRNYLLSEGESPLAVLERQRKERVGETARVHQELRSRRVVRFVPRLLQRAFVVRVLRWTQTCICLRERARLKQALLYSRLRRIVLEIGARLADQGRVDTRDDIFFLTADEIDALVSGSAMFPSGVRAIVGVRREQHARLASVTPPDTLTLAEGEYLPTAEPTSDSPLSSQSTLAGVAACGGVVTAAAAVLADVKESARLRAGDILVTRQTDPGWGPVFPLISGLVVERGGMLSHGAIIAREFGIPSVVGVRDATRRIVHGSVISVDGNRGTVSVLDDAVALRAEEMAS